MNTYAMNTYAWDFAFSEGDSIKEKFDDLLNKISILCVRKLGSDTSVVVSACKEIAGILACSADMHGGQGMDFMPKPSPDGFGEGAYRLIGFVNNDCGGNGYHSSFSLYEDPQAKNEVVVRIGEEKKIIKLFNYPFQEEQKEAVERTIAVRLQGSLFKLLEQKCKERYKTTSEIVRELIAQYVKPQE